MDAEAREMMHAEAYGQAVWSWSPDAGIKLCSRWSTRRWWLTSPVHQGERGVSRKAVAQGVPDRLALPVVTKCLCAAYPVQHARLRVRLAPGIPCALNLWRDENHAKLGRNRAARMRRCGCKFLCHSGAPRSGELWCAIAHLRIHNHRREYGFRARAKRRAPEWRRSCLKTESENGESGIPASSRRWRRRPFVATLALARLLRASGAIYPRGLIDPLGNCPWPGPWIRTYGAHLLS